MFTHLDLADGRQHQLFEAALVRDLHDLFRGVADGKRRILSQFRLAGVGRRAGHDDIHAHGGAIGAFQTRADGAVRKPCGVVAGIDLFNARLLYEVAAFAGALPCLFRVLEHQIDVPLRRLRFQFHGEGAQRSHMTIVSALVPAARDLALPRRIDLILHGQRIEICPEADGIRVFAICAQVAGVEPFALVDQFYLRVFL